MKEDVNNQEKVIEENIVQIEHDEIERKYQLIENREGTVKILKNLSIIFLFVHLAIAFFYPFFTVGEDKYSLILLLLGYNKEVGAEFELISLIRRADISPWDFVLSLASVWYIFLKLVITLFHIFKRIFNFLFKILSKIFVFGFFLPKKEKVITIDDKKKRVDRYIKANSHTFVKGIIKFIIETVITLVFPPTSEILQVKDDATSMQLPLVFAIAIILLFYLPIKAIALETAVAGLPLIVDMKFVMIATVLGILHTLMIIIVWVVEAVYRRRTIE